MNCTKFLIIPLFSSLMLSGCQESTRRVASAQPQSGDTILLDSLQALDSLVFRNRSANAAEAIKLAQQAGKIAQVLKTPAAMAKSFIMLGNAYSGYNLDSGLYFNNKARVFIDSFKLTDLRGRVLYNLGILHRAAGNYKASVILLDSALTAARVGKDFITMSNSLNSLGIAFSDIGDKVNAYKMFNSAFVIAKNKSLFLQMGASLGNLAKFETDPRKARELKNSAISYLERSNGWEEPIALVMVNIAYNFADPDSAIHYLKLALTMVSAEAAPEVFIGAYNNMAYSYLAKSDLVNAEKCITEHAMPVSVKTKNLDWQSTVYDTYADILRRQGKSADAMAYEKKSKETRQTDNKKAAMMDMKLRESIVRQVLPLE